MASREIASRGKAGRSKASRQWSADVVQVERRQTIATGWGGEGLLGWTDGWRRSRNRSADPNRSRDQERVGRTRRKRCNL